PSGVYQGINFVEWSKGQEFINSNKIDILVVSRYIHFFKEFHFTCPNVFIWVHDLNLQASINWRAYANAGYYVLKENMHRITKIICLTEWHKQYFRKVYDFLNDDQVAIIGHGLDLTRFQQPALKD